MSNGPSPDPNPDPNPNPNPKYEQVPVCAVEAVIRQGGRRRRPGPGFEWFTVLPLVIFRYLSPLIIITPGFEVGGAHGGAHLTNSLSPTSPFLGLAL